MFLVTLVLFRPKFPPTHNKNVNCQNGIQFVGCIHVSQRMNPFYELPFCTICKSINFAYMVFHNLAGRFP